MGRWIQRWLFAIVNVVILQMSYFAPYEVSCGNDSWFGSIMVDVNYIIWYSLFGYAILYCLLYWSTCHVELTMIHQLVLRKRVFFLVMSYILSTTRQIFINVYLMSLNKKKLISPFRITRCAPSVVLIGAVNATGMPRSTSSQPVAFVFCTNTLEKL